VRGEITAGLALTAAATVLLGTSGVTGWMTYGRWSFVAEYTGAAAALWATGTSLLTLAARHWHRFPTEEGSPNRRVGWFQRATDTFAPSVALMVAGLGGVTLGLLFISPLTCLPFGEFYLETPPCAVPGSVAATALAAVLVSAVVLGLGLFLGGGYAFRPRSRSAAAICAATVVVAALVVAGLTFVPAWPCPSGCAGETPLGAEIALGTGTVASNASGTWFIFPLTLGDNNTAVPYASLVPSVVTAALTPVRPGPGWTVRAEGAGGLNLAGYDFASAQWSPGAAATVRTGDTIALTCPGQNVSGMYFELGTTLPGWGGTVDRQIPEG
jgi:hypothetical protein